MKLLHVQPYKIYPAKGGGQKCIYYTAKQLQRISDVKFYTHPGNGAKFPFESIGKFSASPLRYFSPAFVISLIKLVKKHKIDLIFFEHHFIAFLPIIFKRLIKCKILIRSHNIEYERFRSMNKWFWKIIYHTEKYVHKKADLNLFIAQQDIERARNEFALIEKRCFLFPYGTSCKQLPASEEVLQAKRDICRIYGIPLENKIYFFNGTLSYGPNIIALNEIVDIINPKLKESRIPYRILVSGSSIPDELKEKLNLSENISYIGFVDNINKVYLAADVFLNPVVEGGGVKTKVIEALGLGNKVVSYYSGASGILPELCEGRLEIVHDRDVHSFVERCLKLSNMDIKNDHMEFYMKYNWDNIGNELKIFLLKHVM